MIPGRSPVNLAALRPWLVLLALLIVGGATSEHFLALRNLLNITRQVSYTGIIGLGMTFVIIAGGIDLSVGSMLAFIGGVIVLSMNRLIGGAGLGQYAAFFLSLLLGLFLGALGGLVSGIITTRFRIAPFITTLGFMGIYRSLALYLGQGGEFRVVGEMRIFSAFGMSGVNLGGLGSAPLPSIIFILLAALFGLVLNWTRFGRYVCAVGSNEKVAAYAAVKVARVRVWTYLILGLTVALSAFLLGGRMNSINSTNAGSLYELDAIAAVVIGGTAMSGGGGFMSGTVAGALILGVIGNLLNMWGISAYLQGMVKGVVIILAVLLQSPEMREMAGGLLRAAGIGKPADGAEA